MARPYKSIKLVSSCAGCTGKKSMSMNCRYSCQYNGSGYRICWSHRSYGSTVGQQHLPEPWPSTSDLARLEGLSLAPLTLSSFLYVCPFRQDKLNHERARIQVGQVSLPHSKFNGTPLTWNAPLADRKLCLLKMMQPTGTCHPSLTQQESSAHCKI